MTTITISDELRDQLLAAGGAVCLVDKTGQAVGVADLAGLLRHVELADATPEQLAARVADRNRPGYTTAEVLAYARARAGQ